LKEEIKELRKTIENHPEVAKFAYENIVMKSIYLFIYLFFFQFLIYFSFYFVS